MSPNIDDLETFTTDVESYKKKRSFNDENLELLSYFEEFAYIGMKTTYDKLRDEYISLAQIKADLKKRKESQDVGGNYDWLRASERNHEDKFNSWEWKRFEMERWLSEIRVNLEKKTGVMLSIAEQDDEQDYDGNGNENGASYTYDDHNSNDSLDVYNTGHTLAIFGENEDENAGNVFAHTNVDDVAGDSAVGKHALAKVHKGGGSKVSFEMDVKRYNKEVYTFYKNIESFKCYKEFINTGIATTRSNLSNERFVLSLIKADLRNQKDCLQAGDNDELLRNAEMNNQREFKAWKSKKKQFQLKADRVNLAVKRKLKRLEQEKSRLDGIRVTLSKRKKSLGNHCDWGSLTRNVTVRRKKIEKVKTVF
mmetsp:Transcript_8562/g.17217  ORF Transcript_8562/g.17217 Transcript_8562/m.17217 type:complete len:366 (+) Transcript_8562:2-1099(+)